jgi:hypothetical protein
MTCSPNPNPNPTTRSSRWSWKLILNPPLLSEENEEYDGKRDFQKNRVQYFVDINRQQQKRLKLTS